MCSRSAVADSWHVHMMQTILPLILQLLFLGMSRNCASLLAAATSTKLNVVPRSTSCLCAVVLPQTQTYNGKPGAPKKLVLVSPQTDADGNINAVESGSKLQQFKLGVMDAFGNRTAPLQGSEEEWQVRHHTR